MTLVPRKSTPPLDVSLTDGREWSLTAQAPEHFTMIVIYRGLHCPICKSYLADLNSKIDDFAARGVSVLALSSDDQDRAEDAKEQWGLDKLDLGFGLTMDQGAAWGLFASTGRGKTSIGIEEPDWFIEPGIFLVRPDGTLYWSSVQTMPFARPTFADILGAINFVIKNDYPARGEIQL